MERLQSIKGCLKKLFPYAFSLFCFLVVSLLLGTAITTIINLAMCALFGTGEMPLVAGIGIAAILYAKYLLMYWKR